MRFNRNYYILAIGGLIILHSTILYFWLPKVTNESKSLTLITSKKVNNNQFSNILKFNTPPKFINY